MILRCTYKVRRERCGLKRRILGEIKYVKTLGRNMEGFALYAELADAIERWLEETGR